MGFRSKDAPFAFVPLDAPFAFVPLDAPLTCVYPRKTCEILQFVTPGKISPACNSNGNRINFALCSKVEVVVHYKYR